MTKWSIQYGDEAGNQFERETDDIGEVHATVDHIVRDEERTAGYAGQTATWHGYEERDAATGHGTGNWSLTVVNLDTHRADGYTHEEWAEIEAVDEADNEAEPIAPMADRALILANMLLGFASLHTAKPNLFVEWQGGDNPITVRKTNGWTMTLATWTLHMYPHKADVDVVDNDAVREFSNPMDAIVHMHNAMMRPEYIARNGL